MSEIDYNHPPPMFQVQKDSVGEFHGIMIAQFESRPVMSKPPEFTAARVFVDRVMHELEITDRERGEKAADWILNLMERFGASTAVPVFFMDGSGPCCSWCGMAWPLCGHQHMSEELGEDDDEEEGEKTQ